MAEAEGDNARGKIDDMKEFHTENTVHFSLTGTVDLIKALEQEGLEKVLKLRTSIATSNIVKRPDGPRALRAIEFPGLIRADVAPLEDKPGKDSAPSRASSG
ncbi:top2 [Symbiodinium sp. CCMP2456]|nr:top2 [Symbiodinium sp. CCMP2456]